MYIITATISRGHAHLPREPKISSGLAPSARLSLPFPDLWRMHIYIYIYIYMYIYIYIYIDCDTSFSLALSLSLYIYIYMYREREREIYYDAWAGVGSSWPRLAQL